MSCDCCISIVWYSKSVWKNVCWHAVMCGKMSTVYCVCRQVLVQAMLLQFEDDWRYRDWIEKILLTEVFVHVSQHTGTHCEHYHHLHHSFGIH